MLRKQLTILFIVFFMSTIFSPISSFAETNIKDCLENEEDCLELDSTDEDDGSMLLNNEDKSSNGKTSSVIINILKIIFALALVLVLIYVLLTLLKRKNNLSKHSQALENLGGISVGQQKSIQVIRIGEKVYAVGIGNDVTMLDEITDENVIRQLEESANMDTPALSFMQQLFSNKKQENNKDDQSVNAQQFSSQLDRELDKLKAKREQLIDMNKRDDDNYG